MTDMATHGDRMKFLHNQWYAAALSTEIGGTPFPRTICGEDVVLFRTAGGTLAALEDRCAHRHAPLSLGTVDGEVIQCAYHGLCFDTDGRCVRVPGQDSVPPQARVRRYPVAERDGWVWLWIGEIDRAAPASIPSLPYFEGSADSAGWAGFQKYFHVKAGAQLFVDNLLDLSHVAFTHRNSIGSSAAADAAFAMEVSVDGTTVRGLRQVFDVEPGPFIANWGNFPGRITRRSRYTWRPPSVIDIEAHFHDAERAITIMVINPITPETETSAHFWIGWARDFALGDRAMTERSVEENTQVIMEDVEVIEAQQRVLSRRPDVRAVPIAADRAVVAVHRVLDRLFADQTTER